MSRKQIGNKKVVALLLILIMLVLTGCTTTTQVRPKLLYYGQVDSVTGYTAIVTVDGIVNINAYVDILDEKGRVSNINGFGFHYYSQFKPGVYYVYSGENKYIISPNKILNWSDIPEPDE